MGHGRFYAPKGDNALMRVPERLLKGIAYIGEVSHEDESGVSGDLLATGFFVFVPSKRFPGLSFSHFVTAKHVADDLKDRNAYILVNGKDGGTVVLTNYHAHWWLHPTDKTADLAVLQVAKQENVEPWAVGIDEFITQDDIAKDRVCIGDEVFITGLFTEAPGRVKNTPIIRHGNIAMLPDEQIQTELGYADVYLVEARSIGGISGSPAFVRPTLSFSVRREDATTASFLAVEDNIKLLGLMHGHWDVKESDINKAPIVHDRKHGVNYGIGIVVPAAKILETIMQPELIKMRELSELDLGKLRRSVPGTDSAKRRPTTQTTPADAEIPIPTQEQFLDDLTIVSRKIKPE